MKTNSRMRNILISSVSADGVDQMSDIQIMRVSAPQSILKGRDRCPPPPQSPQTT
jgi:hypothetical protein